MVDNSAILDSFQKTMESYLMHNVNKIESQVLRTSRALGTIQSASQNPKRSDEAENDEFETNMKRLRALLTPTLVNSHTDSDELLEHLVDFDHFEKGFLKLLNKLDEFTADLKVVSGKSLHYFKYDF